MSSKEEITEFSPLNHGTCRFCNSYGFHRTLTDKYKAEDEYEVYFDMIQECFNLHVTTGDNLNCLICSLCINRLTDSLDFRKMVIKSEIILQKTFAEKVDFEVEVDEVPEYLELKSEPDKLDDVLGSDNDYTDYEVLEDDDIDVLCDQKEPKIIPIEIVSTESKEAETSVAQKRCAYSKKDIQRAAEAVWNCEMNSDQASRHYKVPRTTLQVYVRRLQQKEGGKPRNLRQLVPPTKKLAYTQEDILEAAEAVRSGKMSNGVASRHFGVPRTTLATHVRRLTDNCPDKVESQNSRTQPQRPKYDVEALQKAAEAVQSGKMSNRAASRHYKVPDTTLATYVRELKDPDKAKSQKRGTEPQKTSYTEEDLKKAVEAVRDLKMNYETASKYYNVPRGPLCNYVYTYYGTMADLRAGNKKVPGQPIIPIMIKHKTNITNIMEYTNATPIRCHNDAGYSCSFCKNQYMKPEDLKYHTIHAHDMTTKRKFTEGKTPSVYYVKLDITHLKCTICDTCIDSLEKLMQHLNLEHDKKMYTDIQNRILPFKFETDDFKCAICKQIFGTFKILLMHMNVHYPNYVCKVCHSAFLTRSILLDHEKSHTTGVFNCDECSKVFDNERMMRMHQQRSHVNMGYNSRCGHCGERFKSYQAKLEHLRTVHNISKMFNCGACDKTFKLSAALRLHWKRVHLMERTVKCDECDMKFFDKTSLKKHKLKHSEIRRFQCEFCLKSYQTQSTLREHIRIHKDDRRFKCEHCGMAFVQKCSWRAHMKNKHKVVC